MFENMCFRGSGCAIRNHKHCSYYCNKKNCEGKNCNKIFLEKPEIDLEIKILNYEKTKIKETKKIIQKITEIYSIPKDIINKLPENAFLNSDLYYISEILDKNRKKSDEYIKYDFINQHFLLKINTNFNNYSITERKFMIFFIFENMLEFEKHFNFSYAKKKLREVIIKKYQEFSSNTDKNFVKHFQERFRDNINFN